jgi:Zn-dependent protease with chaperone function
MKMETLLVRLNEKFGHNFTLRVVESDVKNAWTNGQEITFTTGILSLLTQREADAVMLHEFGHAHLGHTHKLMVAFVGGWGVQSGSAACWHSTGDRRWFMAFAAAFTGRQVGEALLMKHFEYQADSFAVQAGYGAALSSALLKITAGHTGEFSLTHPTTEKRVARMAPVDPVAAVCGMVRSAVKVAANILV